MLKKILGFLKTKKGIAIAAIVVIAIVWFFVARSQKTIYQFINVKRGSITEVVSVTGNITSTRTADLAFENGGMIAAVYKKEGDRVTTGDVIARLDTQDLAAQLAQAQASMDAENALLKKLQVGPTTESIAVSETALASANQTLKNSYASVPNTITSAYTNANDAVRNQLNAFFTNPETNNPQVTFPISDSQIVNDLIFERMKASVELNVWQAEDQSIMASASSSALDATLQNALTHLAVVKKLLTTALNAVVNSTTIAPTLATTYKTNVTNGLDEINTSIGNINATIQGIASEKASIAQSQAALNLTLAGSTQEDVDAQAAKVEQAKANVQSIQVKINKASLISPLSGIVTVQNAKVGQIASPGTPVVSLITDNSLQVEANIPEVDIGKVSVGDPVSMTFDAFSGETFTGKIFYVDQSQTIISGVVDYKIKVSFDKNDPRMKSGLTSNLVVTTQKKDNVLVLPQYAILQNDSGTFVKTLANGTVVQTPVTLGISDQNGNVEVMSGVKENEQVINIGLK